MFVIILISTLPCISVEEQARLETFGDEYGTPMDGARRLLPGW